MPLALVRVKSVTSSPSTSPQDSLAIPASPAIGVASCAAASDTIGSAPSRKTSTAGTSNARGRLPKLNGSLDGLMISSRSSRGQDDVRSNAVPGAVSNPRYAVAVNLLRVGVDIVQGDHGDTRVEQGAL